MGANESAQKGDVERENVNEYEHACRYQLMKEDLMKLAIIFLRPYGNARHLETIISEFLPEKKAVSLSAGLNPGLYYKVFKTIRTWSTEVKSFGGNHLTVQLKRSDNLGSLTFNTVMGTEELSLSANKGYPVGPDGKKLKPCCACPETKRARDACIVEKGEEHCTELIEAHKACMRSLGFNI